MPADTATDTPTEVVAFWRNAGPKAWFSKNAAFDGDIRSHFLDLHFAASRAELNGWVDSAEGALALLLLLDQFPRNMFRGSAHAFATDPLARSIARQAVEHGFDGELELELRQFVYLPFEHSEDPADQALAVELSEKLVPLGDTECLRWAKIHQEIIARFARFPHRNTVLGRKTTPEEQAFLEGGGFSG